MNIFSAFFGSVCTEDLIFCLMPSLPSHLENSAELTEFCRFIPSSTRFNAHLVFGVGIDTVRPSWLRLGQVVSDSADFLNLSL